ncbi:hypothetical protein CRE_30231 [Caenorhabditis remanei]|uniref:Protein kinase domain-containing protein n=1 Tax=Caenorhabditis remanei TaxID=31234 RepID=E3NJC8_CAERE|nr:hypothetical protein CRE_30231 [Caenorhabditis remanei]
MNRQISLPVEILDMKIDVSLTCILCGTVIGQLKKEKEVARCNECQFKTEEFCKMKVNVLYSPVYYEVDLNTQAIRQFVTNIVKFAGKDQSEWTNINLDSYWPTWRNKKVEMVLCLREETWSCIGIKGLEEDSKPVSYPQRQESRRRVSRRGEDNGFEYREVKVEEVEEPVDGPRQMNENMTVQGEEQAEGRKRRHKIGGGMRADEAVVRRNQRSRRGKAEHAVLSNINDGDFKNEIEHQTISEDFNDGRIREYDEMEYDNFEADMECVNHDVLEFDSNIKSLCFLQDAQLAAVTLENGTFEMVHMNNLLKKGRLSTIEDTVNTYGTETGILSIGERSGINVVDVFESKTQIHKYKFSSSSVVKDTATFCENRVLSLLVYDEDVKKSSVNLVDFRTPTKYSTTIKSTDEAINSIRMTKKDEKFALSTKNGIIQMYDVRNSSKPIDVAKVDDDLNHMSLVNEKLICSSITSHFIFSVQNGISFEQSIVTQRKKCISGFLPGTTVCPLYAVNERKKSCYVYFTAVDQLSAKNHMTHWFTKPKGRSSQRIHPSTFYIVSPKKTWISSFLPGTSTSTLFAVNGKDNSSYIQFTLANEVHTKESDHALVYKGVNPVVSAFSPEYFLAGSGSQLCQQKKEYRKQKDINRKYTKDPDADSQEQTRKRYEEESKKEIEELSTTRVCESKKSGKLFAVKILPNTKAIVAEKHLLEKEIAIEVKLLHENVVQLITSFDTPANSSGMTKVGTESYQPPEILDGKIHFFPVDIWFLGCLFYECLEAQSPFPQASTKAMIDAIMSGKVRRCTFMSEDSLMFTKQMLTVDPWLRE